MVTLRTAGKSALPQAAVWASRAERTMLPVSRSVIPSGGWYTCHVMMRAAASLLARATVLPVDNHMHRVLMATAQGDGVVGGGERGGGKAGGGGVEYIWQSYICRSHTQHLLAARRSTCLYASTLDMHMQRLRLLVSCSCYLTSMCGPVIFKGGGALPMHMQGEQNFISRQRMCSLDRRHVGHLCN